MITALLRAGLATRQASRSFREVKRSDLVYRFNPRKPWQNLVERQLVASEGHIYHQAKLKGEIAKALGDDVEPHFKHLAIANAREVGAKRPL
jgi:hypothetical protein